MAVTPGPSAQEAERPQSLSFSPSHFAKVAPSDFLHASLTSAAQVRPNGRKTTQVREPGINAGSLTNANGSAVVRLGSTSVVCGVRAELLPVSNIHGGLPAELEAWQAAAAAMTSDNGGGVIRKPDDVTRSDADLIADLRLLVPNLELSTGCNPAHLPGNAPSAEAQALTLRILSLLRTADLVDLAPLLVWYRQPLSADADTAPNPNDPDEMVVEGQDGSEEGGGQGGEWEIKAIWTLYIDILYISLDGAAFDAAWLAVLAALKDTALPKAAWDDERETLICSPLKEHASPLALRALPVPLTAGVFTPAGQGRKSIVMLYDTDDFEEAVCQGQLEVVVALRLNSKGKASSKGANVLRIEAQGKGVDMTAVSLLVKAAEERWKVWQKALAWRS